jgi:rSAM/selenodomain-associated transferase 1
MRRLDAAGGSEESLTIMAASSISSRVLGLFAKWPTPGAVKTRLSPVDPAWGARVAEAFLRDSLHRLEAVEARRVLVFAPAQRAADFARLVGTHYELTPQGEGDLGQRLAAFFTQQFEMGANAVAAVGTDSPTLPIAYVQEAFTALESADVVIGPSTDGGYYLIGCRSHHPSLFENVAWSTNRVLADTINILNDPQWHLSLLPPWYDVDEADDWEMLRGHLAALRRAGIDPQAPHTEALLRSISTS